VVSIDGSFVATTADYITLGSEGRFSADLTSGTDVLVSAPPSAFGFLSVKSSPIKAENAFFLSRPGKHVALIGGGVAITNSTLFVREGTLHLVSVAAEGAVKLDVSDRGATPEISAIDRLGTVSVTDNSIVTAGAPTLGGRVVIRGGALQVEKSIIQAGVARTDMPEGIDFKLSTSVHLGNESLIFASARGDVRETAMIRIDTPSLNVAQQSDIQVENDFSSGKAGALILKADQIHLSDSQVTSRSAGAAAGGDIKIQANELKLSPNAAILSLSEAAGDGGKISIEAGSTLSLSGNARILSDVTHTGMGGDVSIRAANLVATIGGGISLVVGDSATGKGGSGDIAIEGLLSLGGGASIQTVTEGRGDSGSIDVSAQAMIAQGSGSGISSIATPSGTGTAGDLRVNIAAALMMSDRAVVRADTQGKGQGGSASVHAGSIELASRSSIGVNSAGVLATGDAGSLLVSSVDQIVVKGGSQITRSTLGAGSGGDLIVSSQRLTLTGAGSGVAAETLNSVLGGHGGNTTLLIGGPIEMSGGALVSSTTKGPGRAGSLSISAGELSLSGFGTGVTSQTLGSGIGGRMQLEILGAVEISAGANISANSTASGDGGSLMLRAGSVFISGNSTLFSTGITAQTSGTGAGGSLDIAVDGTIALNSGGRISAATIGQGKGGLVHLSALNALLSGAGSGISAQTTAGVMGGRGGDLRLNIADSLSLTDGSIITAGTTGSGEGGTIDIAVANALIGPGSGITVETTGFGNRGDAGTISISGGKLSIVGQVGRQTGISAQSKSLGDAGAISVNMERIAIREGGAIESSAFGLGDGGDIHVKTQTLTLHGGRLSSLGANVANAGRISVNARRAIRLTHGGEISATVENAPFQSSTPSLHLKSPEVRIGSGSEVNASTSGVASAGAITVRGVHLHVRGKGAISSVSTGEGNAGEITLLGSESVSVTKGGRVSVTLGHKVLPGHFHLPSITIRSPEVLVEGPETVVLATTSGSADAGGITVRAIPGMVRINDGAELSSSTFGSGNGGQIIINSDGLLISNGARVTAETFGTGRGGNVLIKAAELEVAQSARIGADAFHLGSGGSVEVRTNRVDVLSGGLITASTTSLGDAGDVSIRGGTVFLDGQGAKGDTGIVVRAAPGSTGFGGGILIDAGRLTFRDGAQAAATSAGQGDAGSIELIARTDIRADGSTVTVQAYAANAGLISIQTPSSLRLERSSIVAQAVGSGGNVELTVGELVLQDSRIVADAVDGAGGRITLNISADGIFGDANDFVVASPFVTQSSTSRISASSTFGVPGTLVVSAPFVDLAGSLEMFDLSLTDASDQLRDQCAARLQQDFSSYLRLGRGGQAEQPDEFGVSF
jgi:large exoprotein involved in heme utilization and adhesion